MREPPPSVLDRAVRVEVRLLGRALSPYALCGWGGLVAGASLALALVARRGESPAVAARVVALALLAAAAQRLATQRRALVFYRHFVPTLAFAWAVAAACDRPAAVFVEAFALGLGLLLALGRVGCFLVGCCHGSPHRWGVRYRAEHAAAGFPRGLVGVPLVPAQLLEAAGALALVGAGVALVLLRRPPGEALTLFLVGHAVVRFGVERLRGDAGRRWRWGLSEAQWWSLALSATCAAAGLCARLPGATAGALGAAVHALLAVILHARTDATPLLLPPHLVELAALLAHAPRDPTQARRSSRGLRVTQGALEAEAAHHYALSRDDGDLTDGEALALGRWLGLVRHGGASPTCVRGRHGVVHLIFRAVDPARLQPPSPSPPAHAEASP